MAINGSHCISLRVSLAIVCGTDSYTGCVFIVLLLLLLFIIIYLICQKRQGDTKRQSLYEGVSLEDTKPKTEGTNTENTATKKQEKTHTHIN